MATCPTCRNRYPNDVSTCTVDGARLLPDEAFTGADADLPAGMTVGEYDIEQKLGEGGFGSVYRAAHPLIGKMVAIKVLNRQYSSNPQIVSRFVAEARAVNQIRHRNIIDIFSFGTLPDGRQYYVMELLEGKTLEQFIQEQGGLTPEVALPILRPVARALDAAHATGIAHRDLKPENIFLVFDEDGNVFPKLLDFGIAKLLGDSTAGHKTRTGAPIGTPYYMSPEQCRGRDVDHRTDIYSFGIVTHVALTGKLPFDGQDVMDLLLKQTTAPAPPVSSVRPELSSAIDNAVLHMLEKDPAARPASVVEAIEALADAAREAGHEVAALPHRGAGRLRSGVTPAELASLAEAKTMATPGTPENGTLRGAEADVAASPVRRTTLALVAAGALALGVGLVLIVRPGAPPTQPLGAPEAPTAPAATDPEPPSPAATVTPKEPAAPEAAEDVADVAIRILDAPQEAEVFLGTERLGQGPGPFRIKRGTGAVKLTVTAPGFSPRDVEIVPDRDAEVSAPLRRAVPASAAPPQAPTQRAGTAGTPATTKTTKTPGPGDLEDPF